MSDRRSNPVDCAAMTARTLTIVLPAYNEAERIGPALDELFGYLRPARRRGARRRPGLGRAPGDGSRSSSSTTAAPTAPPTSSARPERRRRRGRATLSVLVGARTAARARRSGRDARGRRRPRRLRRRRHGDAARPAPAARRGARRRTTSRSAAGSSPTARTCARRQPRYRRLLGKAFHLLASIWVVGPVKDTQCGFKGFTRDAAHDLFARQQITQHRLRRRADLSSPAGAATASRSCRSAGATGAARGCGPGPASRCASRGTCSGSRCIHRRVARRVESASLAEPPASR